jgi:hypothetical protein
MHFVVDTDEGDSIKGWLTPDHPSAIPKFVAVIPGRAEIAFSADVMRPDIRDLGLHANGLCGFDLNVARVPDLAALEDVAIVEAETRLPFYRRFQPGRHVERKLFLYDSALAPQRRIRQDVAGRFSLALFNMERHGLETTTSLIVNPSNRSIVLSGRAPLMRYDHLLQDHGYLRAAILREPREELAERLLFLNFLANEDPAGSLSHHLAGVAALLKFARSLRFDDAKALTAAFRQASDEQRLALASPMTRLFGCEPDENPRRDNVSKALDNLSRLDVVAARPSYGLLRSLVAGLVGAPALGHRDPERFEAVAALADRLCRIGLVNDLLAEDLALYSYAEEALAEGCDRSGVSLAERDALR